MWKVGEIIEPCQRAKEAVEYEADGDIYHIRGTEDGHKEALKEAWWKDEKKKNWTLSD